MDEPRGSGPAVRFDRLGVALMVGGLAVGLVNRALLPGAGECAAIDPISPVLLSASVIAFGFGLVRCLAGRARRTAGLVMAVVSFALVAMALFASANIRPPDCG
jgi:hypothetical protein